MKECQVYFEPPCTTYGEHCIALSLKAELKTDLKAKNDFQI